MVRVFLELPSDCGAAETDVRIVAIHVAQETRVVLKSDSQCPTETGNTKVMHNASISAGLHLGGGDSCMSRQHTIKRYGVTCRSRGHLPPQLADSGPPGYILRKLFGHSTLFR